MFIVYVCFSTLIPNHYSMSALGNRDFCLFHFLLRLSIYNCAWNTGGAQQILLNESMNDFPE